MEFHFDYLWCCDIQHNFLLSSGIKKAYSLKQPDLYYFESIEMTSEALSKFTEKTRLQLVFYIQILARLVMSNLWFQNGIDQAVS